MSSHDALKRSLAVLFRPLEVPDLDLERTAIFLSRNGLAGLRALGGMDAIQRQLGVSLLMAGKLAEFVALTIDPVTSYAPNTTFELVSGEMARLAHEELRGLYYDEAGRLLATETLAVGDAESLHVEPYAALRPAFQHGARRLDLIHNHPSGSAEPSLSDLHMLRVFGKAAREVGVTVGKLWIVTPLGLRENSL